MKISEAELQKRVKQSRARKRTAEPDDKIYRSGLQTSCWQKARADGKPRFPVTYPTWMTGDDPDDESFWSDETA